MNGWNNKKMYRSVSVTSSNIMWIQAAETTRCREEEISQGQGRIASTFSASTLRVELCESFKLPRGELQTAHQFFNLWAFCRKTAYKPSLALNDPLTLSIWLEWLLLWAPYKPLWEADLWMPHSVQSKLSQQRPCVSWKRTEVGYQPMWLPPSRLQSCPGSQ